MGVWLAACATPPPGPLVVGDVRVEVEHRIGTAIASAGSSGNVVSDAPRAPDAVEAEVPVDDASAWVARFRLLWCESFAPDGVPPVAADAIAIVAPNRAQPLQPAPELIAGARVLVGDEGRAWTEALLARWLDPREPGRRAIPLAERTAALLPGTTLALAITHPTTRTTTIGFEIEPRVEILLTTGADGAHPTITLTGTDVVALPIEVAPTAREPRRVGAPFRGSDAYVEPEPTPEPQPVRVGREELVPMATATTTDAPNVIWIPLPSAPGYCVAALLEVRRTSTAEPVASADRALLSTARANLTRIPEPPRVAADVAAALDAFADPEHRRRAFSFVAARTDAEIAVDVALVADDAMLAELVERVTKALGDAPATRSLEELGLALEVEALRFLSQRSDADTTPDALRGVLLLHTGEAASMPAAIAEAARGVRDVAQLRERIVEENRYALEDVTPSARVRAFDWLTARKLAPADFDPLAPARERRAALMRSQPEGSR